MDTTRLLHLLKKMSIATGNIEIVQATESLCDAEIKLAAVDAKRPIEDFFTGQADDERKAETIKRNSAQRELLRKIAIAADS